MSAHDISLKKIKKMKSLKAFLFIGLFTYYLQTGFAQISVGDTMQFWSVSYVDWPYLNWPFNISTPQYQINAVCRGIGEHCYFFTDTACISLSQEIVDRWISRTDSDIVEYTTAFGPLPDIDNDPRVYVMIVNDGYVGYFDPGQLMPDSIIYQKWGKHSSEHEMFYVLDHYAPIHIGNAHELMHMITFNADHSPEPPENPTKFWEEAFIDEGLATFSYDYMTGVFSQAPSYHSSSEYFLSHTNISLINFTDYGETNLWTDFMFEHYGEEEYIHTLINDTLNGIDGVNRTLVNLGYSDNFDDAFERWTITNFLNDSVYLDGYYSYCHIYLANCGITSFSQFPVSTKTRNLYAYSSLYNEFRTNTPQPISINLQTISNPPFRFAFICMNDSFVDHIDFLQINSLTNISYHADNFGINYNRIIMVSMNLNPNLEQGEIAIFKFNSTPIVGIENISKNSSSFDICPITAKNEMNISCELTSDILISIELFNISGEKILHEMKSGTSGENHFKIPINHLPAGIYLCTISSKEFSKTLKVLISE